jgi:hypothetical protein
MAEHDGASPSGPTAEPDGRAPIAGEPVGGENIISPSVESGGQPILGEPTVPSSKSLPDGVPGEPTMEVRGSQGPLSGEFTVHVRESNGVDGEPTVDLPLSEQG